MKRNDDPRREWLLRYLEEKENGMAGVSSEERKAVEAWLAKDEVARQTAQEITTHLRMLAEIPAPRMSADLPSRCLDYARLKTHSSIYSFRRSWILAGCTALLFVFLCGIWYGQHTRQQAPIGFEQLASTQSHLITQLENKLAARYQESTFSAENPWYVPLENLKRTSQAMAAAYQQYKGDPVIVRGLSLAVTQNIGVLQSLHDYLNHNGTIPDQDFRFIDLNDLPEQEI